MDAFGRLSPGLADQSKGDFYVAVKGIGRNIVKFNDIRRTCQELHDNGAINMWMDQRDAPDSFIVRDAERARDPILSSPTPAATSRSGPAERNRTRNTA
jgi:hypothetical protein